MCAGSGHQETKSRYQKQLKSRKCQFVMFLLIGLISIFLGYVILYPSRLVPPKSTSTADTTFDLPSFGKSKCQSIDRDDRYAISLQQLAFLPYVYNGEKKELRIIKAIASSWKDLGLLFGYDVELIAQSHTMGRGYIEDCCKDVVTMWLTKGAPSYPISWNGFAKALKAIELTRITLDIDDALKCPIVE